MARPVTQGIPQDWTIHSTNTQIHISLLVELYKVARERLLLTLRHPAYTHSCITLITELYESVVVLTFSKLQTIYSKFNQQKDIHVYEQKNINDNKEDFFLQWLKPYL